MKALVLEYPGSIDGFKIENINKPVPKDDELLVKVYATSLNPSDYQTAEYIKDDRCKLVLGLDVAGEVVRVGNEVRDFKIGDRVFFMRSINNPNGGFAEYSCTPQKFACKIPDNITYIDAATMPGAGFTAYNIIYQKLRPNKGKTILIQGGAGGVGSYAIQLARLFNLKIITTCLKRDINYVKELGADEAIDFQNENVYERIREITNNKGVDYIINTLGKDNATADLDILKFGGEIAFTASFPDFERVRFYDKGLSIHEIAFGKYLTIQDEDSQKNVVRVAYELSKLMSEMKINTPKIVQIRLEDIPMYLKKIKNGEISGKVVATL